MMWFSCSFLKYISPTGGKYVLAICVGINNGVWLSTLVNRHS